MFVGVCMCVCVCVRVCVTFSFVYRAVAASEVTTLVRGAQKPKLRNFLTFLGNAASREGATCLSGLFPGRQLST